MFTLHDTIAALATPAGTGAIHVIRMSGRDAVAIADRVFKGASLKKQASHTLHYGYIIDGNQVIDEVMISLFLAPRSFTTEDSIEISCHGSPYIATRVLEVLIKNGARMAQAGEFTLRAYLNGRIDLSQAEAVADLIAGQSSAAHDIAMKQMRGGFSHQIRELRTQLLNFVSLIELELDFGEEDVEFARRDELLLLLNKILDSIRPLRDSFRLGNVIKTGVNTVIVGKPNAGKSTLLNALLNEERAIVSEIPGTTRDTIEEAINVHGIVFRFIDTAGLRITSDVIEKIGVERSYDKIKDAAVLLYMCDATTLSDVHSLIDELNEAESFGIPFLFIANKADQLTDKMRDILTETNTAILISARDKTGIEDLKKALYEKVAGNQLEEDQTIVTNLRHYESLQKAYTAVEEVISGMQEHRSGDLLALDLRRSLDALGEISGEVSNDEILGNIFSKFCIGK